MERIEMNAKEEEILKETIQFYSEDTSRRASFDSKGSFYVYDDKMCALGRYLLDPHKFRIFISNLKVTEDLTDERLDEWVKPEGKGCTVRFWNRLQVLHDNPLFWNKKGLTERGQSFVNYRFYNITE